MPVFCTYFNASLNELKMSLNHEQQQNQKMSMDQENQRKTIQFLQLDVDRYRQEIACLQNSLELVRNENEQLKSNATIQNLMHHHRIELNKLQEVHAQQMREVRGEMIQLHNELEFSRKNETQLQKKVTELLPKTTGEHYVMSNQQWCEAWENISKALQEKSEALAACEQKVADLETSLESVVKSHFAPHSPEHLKSKTNVLEMNDLLTPYHLLQPKSVSAPQSTIQSTQQVQLSPLPPIFGTPSHSFEKISVSQLQSPVQDLQVSVSLEHQFNETLKNEPSGKADGVSLHFHEGTIGSFENSVMKDTSGCETHEMMQSIHLLQSQLDSTHAQLCICLNEKRSCEKSLARLKEEMEANKAAALTIPAMKVTENKSCQVIIATNATPVQTVAVAKKNAAMQTLPGVASNENTALLDTAKSECKEMHVLNSKLLAENQRLKAELSDVTNTFVASPCSSFNVNNETQQIVAEDSLHKSVESTIEYRSLFQEPVRESTEISLVSKRLSQLRNGLSQFIKPSRGQVLESNLKLLNAPKGCYKKDKFGETTPIKTERRMRVECSPAVFFSPLQVRAEAQDNDSFVVSDHAFESLDQNCSKTSSNISRKLDRISPILPLDNRVNLRYK